MMMNIYSPKGTKVRFTAEGGYDSQQESAKKDMILGEVYTVNYTDVDSCHAYVSLMEFPQKRFNSCLFASVD